MHLDKSINDFLEYLEAEKGVSPLTIRNYKHYLTRFSKWLNKTVSKNKITDISLPVVRRYRVWLSRLEDNRGETLSKKTQAYHIIALRVFLKWLRKNDYEVLAPEKLDLPKTGSSLPSFLTGEQIERLLNAPSLSTTVGKRDKAILELLFSTGLRVSELVRLDRDRIDPDERELSIVGKGGSPRVVFLSRRASGFLKQYLATRNDRYKPLFIRYAGRTGPDVSDEEMRLTARSVQRMIKKYARKVKISAEVTPHVLRHSFATDLLMAGADIRSVQEMLGHKNIQTTQIYTHVTNPHLRAVHEAFHGKGGKR